MVSLRCYKEKKVVKSGQVTSSYHQYSRPSSSYHYIMMIPKEIEELLQLCNVYVNKDTVAVIQVQPRNKDVYDVYIYTVNGATISCILSKQERLALITTKPTVNNR